MPYAIDPKRRSVLLLGAAALAGASFSPRRARAAEPLRVGLILPMSGPFASTGRQISAAVRLYQMQFGASAADRTIEVILKDDGGTAPETTKRLAQELITRDQVQVLAGFGLTPLALAAAPLATQAKVPMIVMAAATSIIPRQSPFIVRSGFTLAQVTGPLADWAAAEHIATAMTLVSDYGPGLDAERVFIKRFSDGGGKITDSLRVPLRDPDYAPFLQRVKDARPDVVFVFVPSGEGVTLMKQFAERGLAAAGTRLICTGDVLDDDILQSIGTPALGVISSHHYSAAHPSAENRLYVERFMKQNNGMRPNFHSVGGYDGMHLIYEALSKTGGNGDGEALVGAMKSMAWTSVRGPISIDPATRDIVQNVYIRKAEEQSGGIFNIEFKTVEAVKDPTPL